MFAYHLDDRNTINSNCQSKWTLTAIYTLVCPFLARHSFASLGCSGQPAVSVHSSASGVDDADITFLAFWPPSFRIPVNWHLPSFPVVDISGILSSAASFHLPFVTDSPFHLFIQLFLHLFFSSSSFCFLFYHHKSAITWRFFIFFVSSIAISAGLSNSLFDKVDFVLFSLNISLEIQLDIHSFCRKINSNSISHKNSYSNQIDLDLIFWKKKNFIAKFECPKPQLNFSFSFIFFTSFHSLTSILSLHLRICAYFDYFLNSHSNDFTEFQIERFLTSIWLLSFRYAWY